MAIGALLAARELGYRVPEDLSIIGIDGHELGEFFRLTTVDQFPLGQGERAADAILDELEVRRRRRPRHAPGELPVRARWCGARRPAFLADSSLRARSRGATMRAHGSPHRLTPAPRLR